MLQHFVLHPALSKVDRGNETGRTCRISQSDFLSNLSLWLNGSRRVLMYALTCATSMPHGQLSMLEVVGSIANHPTTLKPIRWHPDTAIYTIVVCMYVVSGEHPCGTIETRQQSRKDE